MSQYNFTSIWPYHVNHVEIWNGPLLKWLSFSQKKNSTFSWQSQTRRTEKLLSPVIDFRYIRFLINVAKTMKITEFEIFSSAIFIALWKWQPISAKAISHVRIDLTFHFFFFFGRDREWDFSMLRPWSTGCVMFDAFFTDALCYH